MNDYDKLLQYSFLLLAKKRYTSQDLNKKLQQYLERRQIEDNELAPKVLKRLFQLKYLDDEQFAMDYVSDRINFKPRGAYMIKKELSLKGIDEETVDNVMNELEIDEISIGMRLLNKKERAWQNLAGKAKKEKAFRFLASKGLKIDAIYKAVERCYYSNSEVGS